MFGRTFFDQWEDLSEEFGWSSLVFFRTLPEQNFSSPFLFFPPPQPLPTPPKEMDIEAEGFATNLNLSLIEEDFVCEEDFLDRELCKKLP